MSRTVLLHFISSLVLLHSFHAPLSTISKATGCVFLNRILFLSSKRGVLNLCPSIFARLLALFSVSIDRCGIRRMVASRVLPVTF